MATPRDRLSVPLIATTLAGLAMLGPFSVDTYLPSFPAIGRAFSATPLELQLTLSVYLMALAVMTLFHGTLSDSFGRRPVILGCLVVYTLASIGCTTAQSFGQLLVFRGAQGLAAGAGWVVGRAIVRDVFAGHEAQRVLSMVTMIFGVAPAVAPVIGGWLQEALGWRAVFGFLVVYGALMLAACYLRLPETHPPSARQRFAVAPLARNYLRLGGSPPMLLLCLATALNFAGFFLYVASAPAFIYELLGLGELHFPALFVPMVSGIMLGAFLSGRLAGRMSPQRTVLTGFAILFASAALNLGYHALFPPALPWSVLPIACYAVGIALGTPSLQLIVLDLYPENRGLASSLQGFAHSAVTSLTAGVIASLLSGSAFTLALGQTVLMALGFACWSAYRRLESRSGAHARD